MDCVDMCWCYCIGWIACCLVESKGFCRIECRGCSHGTFQKRLKGRTPGNIPHSTLKYTGQKVLLANCYNFIVFAYCCCSP